MQAILTKYFGPSNVKGSRIKATCERGSITVSYSHDLNNDGNHIAAAQALVDKFVKEDKARYGTNKNPWNKLRHFGMLPNGDGCHVFQDSGKVITLTFSDAEDRANAAKYIVKCIKVRQSGNTATPLAGARASILLCALGRSEIQ